MYKPQRYNINIRFVAPTLKYVFLDETLTLTTFSFAIKIKIAFEGVRSNAKNIELHRPPSKCI